MSGRIPYEGIKQDILVLMEIMKGKRPPRPSEPLLSNDLWEFIVKCWNQRPDIDEVRKMLHTLQRNCSEEALAKNVEITMDEQ